MDAMPFDITIARLNELPDAATPLAHCGNRDVFDPPHPGDSSLGFVLPIGHPGGRDLTYSIGDNDVLDHDLSHDDDALAYVCYTANTEGGSSGCPIFSGAGEVVAVHQRWSPKRLTRSPRIGIPATATTNHGIALANLIRRVNPSG